MKKSNVMIAGLLSVALILSTAPADSYADAGTGGEGCAINTTNFPDENFRKYISNTFDTDSDGTLSAEESGQVTVINVGEMDISSLEGIGYFENVKEIFCYKNKLTDIDVSQNAALEKLHCYNNDLQQLSIDGNINLQYLNCHTNHLTRLNLENNKKLIELDCDRNEMNELNVDENTALEILSCGGNSLQHLDVSNNKVLRQLFCDGNQLIGLDISGNPSMEYCNCAGNQYNVEMDENNQIDLSKLTGEMDVSKADEWVNATIDGNILTVTKGVSTVTYNYDIGNGQKEQFTLKITNNSEEETSEAESESSSEQETSEKETESETEKTTTKETSDTVTQQQTTAGETSSDSMQTKVSAEKKPVVKKVSGIKIKSAKKKLTLSWKKNTSVSGYQIQISTNKKFGKTKIRKVKNKKNKYIFRKLRNKKRYYIRIRAYVIYRNSAGKTQTVYGKWTVKNKKTK